MGLNMIYEAKLITKDGFCFWLTLEIFPRSALIVKKNEIIMILQSD